MSTRLVFRIIYRSVYTLLCFILLVLILVTPGDAIRQALPKQAYHIVIISAAYIGTVLVVGFIYAARLFVNRSILSSIPKSWIPIEKGDVNKQVRKMIAASLSRSAAIAFESRPRDTSTIMPVDVEPEYEEKVKENGHTKPHKKSLHMLRLKKTATMEDELGITLPPHKAVWGEIEHFGWASPNSPDLPNLQYSTVISELPNLIEAKALTLAPPDPESLADPPLLDREAVALLQRPETSPAVSDFVCMYEYARYSTRPISMARFRELMHLFAEVLRGMESLDPAVLNPVDEDDASSESDIDDNAPLQTNPDSPTAAYDSSQFVAEYVGAVSHRTDNAEKQEDCDIADVQREQLCADTASVSRQCFIQLEHSLWLWRVCHSSGGSSGAWRTAAVVRLRL
ncbi:putative sucrase ferredoxin domain-containing protein [Phaeoacremonium minimum UCRPA7]|uniref:Defect at low temperature protein 1 n=1 Tax=Phaeoacremonium minimum (strain UCR-PA7) TaxID=1286976 RepID=R8BWB0_PHAM7|nr:putative sucrase ferredoxin domain-containing protein [Phaeoacremonium minimum UCRPA7]EOO03620.1 putative sucrase ferredoxin domain-containing protein [Phaeoacremonium minimum UCRPA7]